MTVTNSKTLPKAWRDWLRDNAPAVKYAVLNEEQYLTNLVEMGAEAFMPDWQERYMDRFGEPPLTMMEGM